VVRTAAVLGVAALMAGGVWIMVRGLGFHTNDAEERLLAWVRAHREPGQRYFLPVQVPDLAAKVHGSLSSDFKPLPEKRTGTQVIPVDLQGFRLSTGVPLYVDFKSIPYQDADVVEWRKRIAFTEEVKQKLQHGKEAEALEALRKENITHIVVSAGQEIGEGA